MHKNLWITLTAVVCCIMLSSCNLFKAINLAKCNFDYNTVSDIRFLELSTTELLSFSGGVAVTKALVGKSETVPLDMTLHIKVSNPDEKKTAALESLYYRVSLDSVPVGEGTALKAIEVPAGRSVNYPIRLNLDLKQILRGEKKDVVVKAVKGLTGLSKDKTQVTLYLKPTVRVGKNGTYTYPGFIPVSFSIGGK